MTRFVRVKGYPTDWWMRSFALALLRVGVCPAVLPRSLRQALGKGGRRPTSVPALAGPE